MTPTILVVDDDDALVRFWTAIFEREGYRAVSASDGSSGLRQAMAHQPDLVLLDVRLPGGMDGLTVLEQIKSTMPTVAVVMLTGSSDIDTAVRATQLGAFDYLTKPASREQILVAVRPAS